VSVTEKQLVRLVRQKLDLAGATGRALIGPGDDAACLPAVVNRVLLFTVDVQTEGVHFDQRWTPPFLIGARSLLVSISDVFAMGGRPNYCLCSLGVPQTTTAETVDEFYDGLILQAKRFGVGVVGGNFALSQRFSATVAVLGTAPGTRTVARSGARPGDAIYVTGTLGGAAAALRSLKQGRLGRTEVEALCEALRQGEATGKPTPNDPVLSLLARFFLPQLRSDEAVWLAGERIPTAMIDISDGIASDLRHICEASGVGAVVEVDKVPLFDTMPQDISLGQQELTMLALAGGEDYELLFTVGPERSGKLVGDFQRRGFCRITRIGRIVDQSQGVVFTDTSGRKLSGLDGFDHMAEQGLGEAGQ